MAQIFGEPSKYLRSKDIKYWLIAVGLGVGFFLFVYIFFKIPFFTNSLICLAILFISAKALPALFDYFKGRSDNYHDGLTGENDIADILNGLPYEFKIFRGLQFDKLGDVDFTVVGPTGIFTVDAKNFKARRVEFNGEELIFDGRVRDKNVLKQATREALAIKELLTEKLKVSFFVEPVLVFSHYVRLHFGFNKQKGVYVIGSSFLINLLKNKGSKFLSSKQIEQVVNVLYEKLSLRI